MAGRAPGLLIFPADPRSPPVPHEVLLKVLRETGLVGAALPGMGMHCYQAGDRFMQCITFLGCSPVADLSGPVGDGDSRPNLYHIELSADHDAPVVVRASEVRPPRCPQCRTPWPEALALLDSTPFEIVRCPACGSERRLHQWNWRQQIGFGRQWITVRGVHEGEAVPSEGLLESLEEQTGREWRYAYCA